MTTGSDNASAAPRVAVIGGGTMGAAIAHVFLDAGAPVVLVEADRDAADRAHARLAESLRKGEERGKLAHAAADDLERLRCTDRIDDIEGSDVVIEAVPEDVGLKRGLLAKVEALVGDTTVLATNTSSLSVDAIGADLGRPARLVGMHFFNPVPASALVEVVRGHDTDQPTLETVHRLVALLGKESIEVSDSPGFATSRLGLVIALEAIRMVESGVASAEEIDKGMVLGYRHPMGPLRLTDLVGLDVRLHIAEYLHATLGPRFEVPSLLRDMVAAGTLGRKTGQGFYTWGSR
jgi:3-hydroxybutyryl-CoA dehydrogenase